jgi:hypothetical protein
MTHALDMSSAYQIVSSKVCMRFFAPGTSMSSRASLAPTFRTTMLGLSCCEFLKWSTVSEMTAPAVPSWSYRKGWVSTAEVGRSHPGLTLSVKVPSCLEPTMSTSNPLCLSACRKGPRKLKIKSVCASLKAECAVIPISWMRPYSSNNRGTQRHDPQCREGAISSSNGVSRIFEFWV